jgi:hypothetical protein
MSTAVVLIAFAAYAGILAKFAMAIRNRLALAAALIGAGATYAVLRPALDVTTHSVAMCALLFAVGFFIPSALLRAEGSRVATQALALSAAVLATAFAADFWWRVARLLSAPWYAGPALWFAAGVATFLVIVLRFFEEAEEVQPRRAA